MCLSVHSVFCVVVVQVKIRKTINYWPSSDRYNRSQHSIKQDEDDDYDVEMQKSRHGQNAQSVVPTSDSGIQASNPTS